MDSFFASWLVLTGVFAIALASPGPDLVMAVRNSITGSRRAGIFTAIGFGLGVVVHVTYCLAGLALIIAQSALLFTIIKWIGAAYLFYGGFHALRSHGLQNDDAMKAERGPVTAGRALRDGFITNLFNPKATLFFLALFTQILAPDIGIAAKIAYGATCVVMTVMWFSLVATILTAPRIRTRFMRASKWIDRICGGVFIALGLKLPATKI